MNDIIITKFFCAYIRKSFYQKYQWDINKRETSTTIPQVTIGIINQTFTIIMDCTCITNFDIKKSLHIAFSDSLSKSNKVTLLQILTLTGWSEGSWLQLEYTFLRFSQCLLRCWKSSSTQEGHQLRIACSSSVNRCHKIS